MMIPHPVKVVLLELAHLTYHLLSQVIARLILAYYYLLTTISNIEQRYSIKIYDHYILINDLSKMPKHIALAFTNEMDQLDLDSIARLLCWCKQLRIQQITLYDDLGRLKDRQKELVKQVGQSMGCDPIEYLEGINIISRSDGRQRFVEDVKELVKLEKINFDQVNNLVGWSTDPELLISFGTPLCLYGFPPWQLRLTEILSIPTHRNLPKKIFYDCLNRYSKTSQRVGV